MPRSCTPETPPLGPASSTSSFSSAQPTLSSNSSMPRLAVRKSVPTLSSEPVDVSSQSAEASGQLLTFTPPPSFQQRSNMSNSSPASLEQRTASSPTSPPFPTGLTPRSLPLTPAGQSAAGPAPAVLPSSLSRNASVPASLAHTVPSPNIPTRSRSASSTSRPSLSFPSPPTPVVPSIPLRHATQHSTTQSTNTAFSATASSAPNTPPSVSASRSRESIDPQPSSKRHLTEPTPGITPLTTASDPNLPPPRPSAPNSPSESTHWALTLKQLLAKPAVPVNLASSSESESGQVANISPTSPSRHRRSVSTIDHPQRASDLNIESPSTTGLGVLDMFRSRQTQTTSFKDTSDSHAHYHDRTNRRHMAGRVSHSWTQNKDERGEWNPGHSIFWPEWKSNDGQKERKPTKGKERVKDGEKEKEKEPRVRNVLRRRPSAGFKVSGPRPRGSTSPTLSRATSMTSLVKQGILATPAPAHRPSTAHGALSPPKPSTPYQSPPASPSGPRPPAVHDKGNDQGAPRSRAYTTRSSTAPGPGAGVSRDVPSSSSTSSSIVVARVSTQGPSSSTIAALAAPGPGQFYKVQDSAGMQSAASSASSTSRRGYSKDRALSPAGAVADAYKREQLAKGFPPSSPYRPHPPDPPSIIIDTGDIRGVQDTTNRHFSAQPESKNSSRSDLSYAELGSEVRSLGAVEQVLSVPREYAKLYQGASSPGTPESAARDSPKGYRYTLDPKLSPSTPPHPPPPLPPLPSPANPSPPLTSPPPRTSSSREHMRHRPKAIGHSGDGGGDASSHTPYYTVFGGPTDQVVTVGGPRDSYGANYSPLDQSLWGVQTTITTGKATEAERERRSLRRSLSRTLSGKFKRDRSAGAGEEGLSGRRGRSGWQDRQGLPTSPRTSLLKSGSEKEEERCLPPILSPAKHAPKEIGGGTKEKSGRLLKFWRFKVGSKEGNESFKVEDPPPLPTLPKHYHPRNASQPGDIYTPINPRRAHSRDPSPLTKSPRSPNSNMRTKNSRSGRPSTAPSTPMSFDAASKFWNRTHSARSSYSSIDDRSVPNPRRHILAKMASTEDTAIQKVKPGTFTGKPINAPRKAHTDTEGEPYKLMTDAERSNSPPIPLFSNADVINSFPPRRSSDRSKNSPTSPSSSSGATPPVLSPAPASSPPPPRPQRSSRRPKGLSRPTSPNDEPLYPPVMKQAASAVPKMTFREIDSPKRIVLTEQEKADRWNALLERSEAAGGTLHFGGDDDKLPSDELRFSRTLSELARDDD